MNGLEFGWSTNIIIVDSKLLYWDIVCQLARFILLRKVLQLAICNMFQLVERAAVL